MQFEQRTSAQQSLDGLRRQHGGAHRSPQTGDLAGLILIALVFWVAALPELQAVAQIRNNEPGQPFASLVACLRPGESMGLTPDASPRLASACFASAWSILDYNTPDSTPDGDGRASDPSLLSFGDSKPDLVGGETAPTPLSTAGNVGAIYGLAYSSGTNSAAPAAARGERMFMSAFTKRFTRFGAGGPGAIYVRDAAGSVRVFARIPNVVSGPWFPGSPGDGSGAYFPNDSNQAGYIPQMGGIHRTVHLDLRSVVGTSSLGDLDLDPNERYLYVVNLYNRHVYRIDTWSADPQASIQIIPALPGFSNPSICNVSGQSGPDELRPFGLHLTQDSLYLGYVCTASRRQDRRDLFAGVWRYNLSTQTWDSAPALHFGLASTDSYRAVANEDMHWRPWVYGETLLPNASLGSAPYPQAILADLAIAEDGALILGFRDRSGDMSLRGLARNDVEQKRAYGDLMRAAPNGPHTWNQPEEFFLDQTTTHRQSGWGGLAYLPGLMNGQPNGTLATTLNTPYRVETGGIAWYAAQTSGSYLAREELYRTETTMQSRTFGKSAGLGDLEVLCVWSSVGDRVWADTNANGLQDAGEPGIDGVRLELFAAHDTAFTTPLARVTTGAINGIAGSYRFYLPPFQAYRIRIDPLQFEPGQLLQASFVTIAKAGPDTIDSDADQLTRAADVPSLARDARSDQLDIGIAPLTLANGALGGRAWNDQNGDGIFVNLEPGLSNVTVRALECRDRTPACTNAILYRSALTNAAAEQSTGSSGTYLFAALPPNYYRIEFVPLPGMIGSPLHATTDDLDSDANASTNWLSHVIAVRSNSDDRSIAAGMRAPVANLAISQSAPPTAPLNGRFDITLRWSVAPGGMAQNVVVSHRLPPGLSFVSSNPPTGAGAVQTWNLGNQAGGASGQIVVTVQANVVGQQQSESSISSDTPDTNPSDNTARSTTLVNRPNVSVQISGPATAAPGEAVVYRITVKNQANALVPNAVLGAADDVQLLVDLPNGMSYQSASSTPNTRQGQQVRWNLNRLVPGASLTLDLVASTPVSVPPERRISLSVSASVSTTTPGDDPHDNNASATTEVRYPNVWVTISAPATVGLGGRIRYEITYGNNGAEQAANSGMMLHLPSGTTLRSAMPNQSRIVGSSLLWSLNTLLPGDTGSIIVDTDVALYAGALLVGNVQISTATPGDDPRDNRASASTTVIAAPLPPPAQTSMRLALHSELDPLSRDQNTDNGVYASHGDTIAWPAGEVLDVTPLLTVTIPTLLPPEDTHYALHTRIVGWSLADIEADGRGRSAEGGDDMGRSGCRERSRPIEAVSGLDGCTYRYVARGALSNPATPAEAEMALQAHLFFAVGLPLQMRPDVYVYNLSRLERVQVRVQAQIEVLVVNRQTDVVVREERQMREQRFVIRLVAPRSVR